MNEESPIKIWPKIRRFWRKRVPLSLVVPIVLVALIPEILRHFQTRSTIQGIAGPEGRQVLGIKDLVQEVRAELAAVEAEMRNKNEKALFELTAFEMELNFVVKASSTVTGGVKTELVTAESEVQAGSEKVQKLTLHWKAAEPEKIDGRAMGPSPTGVIVTPAPPKKGMEP